MTARRHDCPAVDVGLARQLVSCVRREPWLLRALDAVAASGLPDAWIGAGVIRDVVWGQARGGFDPAAVRDIDVAFFDPGDLSRQRDQDAQQVLQSLAGLPWEATNQAAVHTWYHHYFGGPPVPAFTCVHDAVATWPETATCVAIRSAPGGIEICAPYGLADLMNKIWRPNEVRVSIDVSRARLARHREQWPEITVVPLATRPPARPRSAWRLMTSAGSGCPLLADSAVIASAMPSQACSAGSPRKKRSPPSPPPSPRPSPRRRSAPRPTAGSCPARCRFESR